MMEISIKEKRKGFVFVLLASILWGISGVFGQFLFQQRGLTPEWVVIMRLIVPGAIFLCWAIKKSGLSKVLALWQMPKTILKLFIYAIFGTMAVQYTFLTTVEYSNAATASILQFLNPVLIALYLAVSTRTFPDFTRIIAIILALLGTFLLVTHGRIDTLLISPKALCWGIASAFASAFYLLYSVSLMRVHGTFIIMSWSMLIGGIAMSLFYPPWQVPGVWDLYTYVGIFYMVILGALVTFSLFLVGAQLIGSGVASILNSFEPLSAAVFSVLFLNVSFGLMDWIGSLCIMITVILLANHKN